VKVVAVDEACTYARDGLAMGFKMEFIGVSDFHEAPCGSLIELKQYERWARIGNPEG